MHVLGVIRSVTGAATSWHPVLAVLLSALLGAAGMRTAVAQDANRLVPEKRIRIDAETGLTRADFSIRDRDLAPGSGLWRETAAAFGWSARGADLEKVRDVHSGTVRHETWQQYVKGLPLVDAYVRVSIATRASGGGGGERVSSIMSAYRPVSTAEELETTPRIAASEATRAAVADVVPLGAARTSAPRLAVRGDDALRLVWTVTVWPHAAPAEWRVLVDAVTGRVLERRDMAFRHRQAGTNKGSAAAIDGQGLVFDPSPLMTAGAPYGAPFVDADDGNSPALTAELREVVLPDLDVDAQGNIRLEGPFVRITGELAGGGSSSYVPPVATSPAAFRLDRNDIHFEAVMSYYHIDKSQRYVQQLGFNGRQEGPLAVNPRGITRDESFYFPSGNLIVFGTGGVDDGEDATVVWHEYAHALLEAASPGLNSTLEGTAVHEGWADYWAVSYQRHLVETGQASRQDWETLFAWDSGDGLFWPGRVMDFAGNYPGDTCSDRRPAPAGCSPHDDGRLLATALMDVQDALGREVTDQLVLFSHPYLAAPVTFRDAGDAILQADLDHFGGDHTSTLVQILGGRGLINDASVKPLVEHSPVAGSDNLGGDLSIEVNAVGVGAPIDQVVVFAESSTQGAFTVSLTQAGDDRWEGGIPLPAEPDSLFYYISATDSQGRVRLLPDGAPGTRFGLLIGTDTAGPAVAHTPIGEASMATWPVIVRAGVTDNFSVGDVQVEFVIEDIDGSLLDSGSFSLSAPPPGQGSEFEGAFPTKFADIEKDAHVAYRIRAVDGSVGKNETVMPADGWFSFRIRAEGLLRSFGLLSEAVSRTAAWNVAAAGSVGGLVPAGSDVAWVSSGAQTGAAARASIELAPINLRRQTAPALLTFWYRSRLDHAQSQPSGANVKIQVGESTSWDVALPLGGYPSVLSRAGHVMDNQPVFAADTYGWQFAAVELPSEKDVAVRFDLAVGSGELAEHNEFRLAGVRITTLPPNDVQAPIILSADHADRIAIRSVPGQGQQADNVVVTIQAFDDLGLQSAVAQVTLPNGTQQAVPLRQDTAALGTFSGVVGRPEQAVPGAILSFRVTGRDWSGQTVVWPAAAQPPLSAVYVLSEASDLLSGAVTAGGWAAAGTFWRIQASDISGHAASLSTRPVFVPDNAEKVSLRLLHDYVLPAGQGATIQVSTSDGAAWTTVEPEGGYSGDMRLDAGHPFAGTRGFRGTGTAENDLFDVSQFQGEELLVRLLFATEPGATSGSSWVVASLELVSETQEAEFVASTRFSLNTVYPNPVRNTFVVTYSLEEAEVVELELYDTLGRRIATLDGGPRSAGSHSATYDASRLSGGMYVVRLRAGGQSESRTVVKL